MSAAAIQQGTSDYFRIYRRLLVATGFAILLLTLAFLGFQVVLKKDQEILTIQGHVERHAQSMEFMARGSVDQAESARMSAEAWYELQGAPSPSTLYSQLQEEPDGGRFNLDRLVERDSSGNLTGAGRLVGRSTAFYRDVEMALSLAVEFQTIGLTLPNAANARLVGLENFSYVFPWQESKQARFSDEDYQTPIWKLGTPEVNPGRRKFWAPVYFGGRSRGLLAPVGVPVYDHSTFRGVISIDTSIDYVNRYNRAFAYPLGTSFVVDGYGQIIAHPHLYRDALAVTETLPLEQARLAWTSGTLRLDKITPGVPVIAEGHLLFRYPLASAPWNVIYVLPLTDLWGKLLGEVGPAMLAVLLALGALMIATYLIISREFISPAGKLVEQIAARSQFKVLPIPLVPNAWKPWFQAVSQAFQESMQLAGIRQELDIAANMQQSILPRTWPKHHDYSLWGTMRPAKEVGGDFYDHFSLAGSRIGLVVADVSGKGMPAALFSMVSKTMIRATALGNDKAAGAIIEAANDQLSIENDACMFVTTLYLEFDPADGTVLFVNGGHPPPLLVHADGSSEFLESTGDMALGIMEGLFFRQVSIRMVPGDFLLIYTDGITEAFSSSDEEFGPARLPPLFAGNPPTSVRDAVARVIQAVDQHSNGVAQSDDMTCLALAYAPAHEIVAQTGSGAGSGADQGLRASSTGVTT